MVWCSGSSPASACASPIGTADENDRVVSVLEAAIADGVRYSGTHSLTSSPMPSIAVRTI